MRNEMSKSVWDGFKSEDLAEHPDGRQKCGPGAQEMMTRVYMAVLGESDEWKYERKRAQDKALFNTYI